MGKIKNTIKINGHLYDAGTGAPINGSGAGGKTPRHRSVDGFIAHPKQPLYQPKPIHQKSQPIKITPPPKKPRARSEAPAAKRNVEHSHTLMRQTVKKPSPTKHLKSQSHLSSRIKPSQSDVSPKLSVRRINQKRLKHANKISKSQAVSRFGDSYLAVAPVGVNVHKAEAVNPPKPELVPERTHTDIFEHAVKHATSHTQPPPKRQLSRKHRIASYSALAIVTVVLLGVVTSQSLSGVKLHMASARAGFAASLPGYKPAGYHLGHLNSSAGVVALNYKSNSDESREFAITQKSSSWDSNTLRDLFVQSNDKNYRAVDSDGLTIFIYGQNNATWVDKGVWYQVHGTGSLSEPQLIDIAKSL